MPSANDFLTSRGAAGGNLTATGTLILGSQIGSAYKPYLISDNTVESLVLNTPVSGVPATAQFFLLSVWLNIPAGADGVYFPFQNFQTPGIAISAFSSFAVQFRDANLNNAILNYWRAVGGNLQNPGLNNLIVSCDTVGQVYEAVLNGATLAPVGAPDNVTTSFTMDNSNGLFLLQPDANNQFTELWFDFPASYISAPSVVAKFYNGGNPVDPLADGSGPFGSKPVGYFTVRDSGPPPSPSNRNPGAFGVPLGGGQVNAGGNHANTIAAAAAASGLIDPSSDAGASVIFNLSHARRSSYWPDYKVAEGVR